MRGASDFGRAWNPLLADGCEHIGAALNGGALHVVHDTSDAAHLFAAACAAWAAVNHMRERRTVACALLHRVAVVDIDAPVPRRGLGDKGRRDGRISCDQRGDKAALALGDERRRMGQIAVAHHGAHRAESLCGVDLCCGVGIFAVQEHGRNKGALGGHAGFVTPDNLAFGGERIDHGEHITLLAHADERAHAGALFARIADCESVELGADRFYDGLDLAFGGP